MHSPTRTLKSNGIRGLTGTHTHTQALTTSGALPVLLSFFRCSEPNPESFLNSEAVGVGRDRACTLRWLALVSTGWDEWVTVGCTCVHSQGERWQDPVDRMTQIVSNISTSIFFKLKKGGCRLVVTLSDGPWLSG